MDRLGVIIANTGSPDEPTPDAVRRYLSAFLTDKRIMPINPIIWKPILNLCILPTRSKKSAHKYAQIWTESGSPLIAALSSLASKLESHLNNCEIPAYVRSASSYGTPSLEDAFSELSDMDCKRIVVIPLYPQSAFSTTYVVNDKMDKVAKTSSKSSMTLIGPYSNDANYLEAIIANIQNAGFGNCANDKLLFAFHSIPMNDINSGDTYDQQVYSTVNAIVENLKIPDDRWGIGFQCKFDKSRKWLQPSTHEALNKLCDENWKGNLFVVAPNFSIDCLETLYDINIQLRKKFAELTGASADKFVYIPCLNDSDTQVEILTGLLKSEIS